MSTTYFQRLKELVESGRLRTYIIIAPPRTNSSVVEHALGNSLDLEHEIHEPFLKARHDNFDPEHGYRQIYEAIGGEKFEHSEDKTSIVIKEMSHWIAKNEEYKRLFELTTSPVLVLIRNHLLSAESRLRRVLVTMDMRYGLDTQRYLLDEVAVENGLNNWFEFASKLKIEGYKDRPDFLENKEGVERIYDTPVLTVQNNLLDLKAHKHGYANWRDLVDKKLYKERDYNFFEGVLGSNERRLEFEKSEFAKLTEEVEYLKDQDKSYFIIDTTDLRAAPEEQLKEICFKLGITFSPEMIRWGQKPVDFQTEQTYEHERLWYDTLYSSSRINPPTEIPPRLSQFPAFMQSYLREQNIPIYAMLSREKLISDELSKELNDYEISVKINDGNRGYLDELGLVEDKIEIGESILIKLKYIDPVYAVSNDPELLTDPEFTAYRDIYSQEIKVMSESIAELNELRR